MENANWIQVGHYNTARTNKGDWIKRLVETLINTI